MPMQICSPREAGRRRWPLPAVGFRPQAAAVRQNATQVPFTEDEHVIQTLLPDRTDEALREGILPWAVRGREDFLDVEA